MASIALKSAGVIRSTPLFSNLSLDIGSTDRIGLIAGNGRGKTTLLRCIAGLDELSEGEITTSRNLTIGYVPQDVPEHLLSLSLRDAIGSALTAEEREMDGWRIDVALDELRTPAELAERRVDQLSGGWQRLMLLARVWITQPDALLLDEPTNHLDLARIFWLEDWLNTSVRDVPVIISSHDRAFLDATTNRTVVLRPGQSHDFAAPYSRARVAMDEMDAAAARQQSLDFKEARKLRQQAAKLKNVGINSGSDLLTVKAKQLKERAARIEDAAVELHKERSGAIRLANSGTHAKVLVTLEDAEICTPDGQMLFRTGKQFIFQGDRIVVLGGNGTGKSRLVNALRRAILDQNPPAGIKATPSVVLGYMDQALSDLPTDQSAMEFISSNFRIGDQRTRAVLADAGFEVERQSAAMGKLSFGQRSRLSLLALRLRDPNFYLLDEPTNHLDIDGQERLETEVLEHGATCVLVSHDRSFIRSLGTRYWLIERGKLVEVDTPEPFFESMRAQD